MTLNLIRAALVGAIAFGPTISFADDTTHGAEADAVESAVLKAEDRDFFEAFGPVQFANAFGSREMVRTAHTANFRAALRHQTIHIRTDIRRLFLRAK